MNLNFWNKRSVFVTGHTGFKGSWLSLWLTMLGAKVHGYSLPPPTTPSFYSETLLSDRLESSTFADIRDQSKLATTVRVAEPSVIIHLAAQPLVRESYKAPIETFTTNVLGTTNLLEAIRNVEGIEAVIIVTTDKCYRNNEWVWSYRENDNLGGTDPYSSSKACAELVTAAYRDSFLAKAGVHVASVRAGNVIGGGDWSRDRLIPDILRALDADKKLYIRYPNAVRPWQHVLDPLDGYLKLAERLVTSGNEFAEAWNFGPEASDTKSVSWIMEWFRNKIPDLCWELQDSEQPHEALLLKLDSSKAKMNLDWSQRWSLATGLEKTLAWHQSWREGLMMAEVSANQIRAYQKA